MNTELRHYAIEDGGTRITNFPKNQYMKYHNALSRFEKEYGASSLVISDVAYNIILENISNDYASLHVIDGKLPENIWKFWMFVRGVA